MLNILGADLIKQYKLNCLNYSNCEKYDETVDPSTFIEYSSNAFRWYHTNVPDFIHLVDDCGKFLEKIPLSDTYLKLDLLKTRLKDVVNGHMAQGQRMRRAGYSDEVINDIPNEIRTAFNSFTDGLLFIPHRLGIYFSKSNTEAGMSVWTYSA